MNVDKPQIVIYMQIHGMWCHVKWSHVICDVKDHNEKAWHNYIQLKNNLQ